MLGELALEENDVSLARGHFGYAYEIGVRALPPGGLSGPLPYDLPKARQLLAEAGFPNGFDAGEFAAIPGFPTVADAVVNDLNAAGIRVKLRSMERGAFYTNWRDKKLPGLFMAASVVALRA